MHSHAERGNDQSAALRSLRTDRFHAPRGNAAGDAPRSAFGARLESGASVTRSVTGCIPTQERGNDQPAALRALRTDRSHAPRGNAAGDAPRSAFDARL
ncbi:hypothetical protein SAMN04490206_0975 [Pseudomonas umsongensis]|nr:hypothetical protein SAMN04490206_0975 [Pseudomonas umsongensis]